MEVCIIATKTPKLADGRTMDGRVLAVEAARLAAETRCHNVVVLDVKGISPVTDFFVLASGTSSRQMRSVAEDIEELAEKHGTRAFSRAGYEGDTWILVDFVDVVVHIFNDDARNFYDLDNLWGDARRIDWKKECGVTR